MDQIASRLRSSRFRYSSERELQDGIAQLLTGMGVIHEREVRLSNEDVIDFLVSGGLGIEVKIQGTIVNLLRQLNRYAQHQDVKALLVVTGRMQLTGLPRAIGGKPLRVVSLLGSLL